MPDTVNPESVTASTAPDTFDLVTPLLGLQRECPDRSLAPVPREDQPDAGRIGGKHAALLSVEALSSICHEIRTPASCLLGLVDLLSMEPTSTRQRALAGTMRRTARTLLAMADDVLSFSTLQYEAPRLDVAPANVREVVEDIGQLMTGHANDKGVSFSVIVERDLTLPRRTDRTRLHQILVNLVRNALKFTDEGAVSLRASVHPDDPQRLVFEVSDTGAGIDPARHREIFEPLVQLGDPTHRSGGSGLGLAIVRTLVTAMAGSIEVDSQPGEGSRFRVELPMPEIAIVRARQGVAPGLEGLLVMVISDHDGTRESLQEQLSEIGIPHCLFRNGQSAVASLPSLADRERIAVIVDDTARGLSTGKLITLIESRTIAMGTKCKTIFLTDLNRMRAGGAERSPNRVSLVKPTPISVLRDHLGETSGQMRSHARTPQCASAPSGQGMKVLVVDDDPGNRALALEMFQLLGAQCTPATDGREAVDLCRDTRFDLVVMDYYMPRLNGLEALAEIRKLEADNGRRASYIVSTTASIRPGERERSLASGMDDHLYKPLSLEQMATLCERAADVTPLSTVEKDAKPVPILDHGVMDTLESLGPDFYNALLRVFVATWHPDRAILEVGMRDGNLDMIRSTAGRMKSCCTSMGARTLNACCEAVEAAALAGDLERVRIEASTLNESFHATLRALRDQEEALPSYSAA